VSTVIQSIKTTSDAILQFFFLTQGPVISHLLVEYEKTLTI
jgi:hypothetical protein